MVSPLYVLVLYFLSDYTDAYKMYMGGVLSWLFTVSVIGYLIPIFLQIRLPWSIDSATVAVVFYGIGWCLRKENLISGLNAYRAISIIGSILCIVFCTALTFFNSTVNIRTLSYGNCFAFYGSAVGFSIAFCTISYQLMQCKHTAILNYLAMLGRHTLIIASQLYV